MIQVEKLVKTYENGVAVHAVNDVSFEVEAGKILALVGPSGSGKSTLLNLIGALDAPSSGRVIIDGIDINSLHGDELADFRREKIGFVFQAFHLVPSLTAIENVMLPLFPYQRQCKFNLENRASDLLANMGLAARNMHFPSQLSGGEQQRVAIARALVNRPAYLLADEPTGELDSATSRQILSLFHQIVGSEKVTILMVTHDPRAGDYADRIIELQDGVIKIS
ncbi:MAG: ABC transporter ATP-binding protein [Anaerolineaceae bacterium]|nr:ABC transporter ATP-binding protein [Anaerolineaceae bacterium]